jgi:DNA helicase-2/ATP-dependent DNA helicase PcrA|tara:strand:+ start:2187 stop:4445 length:2259 start_codon:yes stop_codon:yes gene_type:complete
MQNYLEKLNPEQRKAVEHITGPLMVIAGAGSGKTRVLTYRIIHLINNNVSPFSILALTFTNKAAKEMRNRIDSIVGKNISRDLWMGTFHSIFSRILRIEAHKLNYPTNFTIYDTDDAKSLIRSIIKELNLDKDIYKVSIIINRISALKNNFITHDQYNSHQELVQTDKIAKRTEFQRIYAIYSQRCLKASAMDFDDLLLNTYQLLNNFPDALLKYQSKFKYILIDEYQDTNHVQYLIIKKLAALHENICIVGDDAQSIYSFRGAKIQNILNFKSDYPDFKSYKLEQNYRSTNTIVETANSLIKHNENQIPKEVWTENEKGEKIILCKCGSDNDEGRLVANTIFEIKMQDQAYPKDFAILYRTNAQSRALEEALRKQNIPYKIYGGLSFYQRKEIKDILSYCRLTINPNDEEALKRVINYPGRGIGNTTMQKLLVTANENNISIWEVMNNLNNYKHNINNGTSKKLVEFVLLIRNYQAQLENKDAYFLAEHIAKSSGVFGDLYNDKSPEGVSRFENIQELLNGIKDFCENTEVNSLADYMKDVALLTNQDNEKQEDFNKVTLMTIHAAKGLEFPYVFVVGLEQNLFPSMMSGESQEDLEEERRLFYVAITRAEKRLFLSFATNRFKWGQYIDCEPSRFLSELNTQYISKTEIISKQKNKFYNNKKQVLKNKFEKKNNTFKLPPNLTKLSTVTKIIKHSDLSKIQNGMKVLHSKFGNGKILEISGDEANKKATIFFENVGQKQLLLKFAKLEII